MSIHRTCVSMMAVPRRTGTASWSARDCKRNSERRVLQRHGQAYAGRELEWIAMRPCESWQRCVCDVTPPIGRKVGLPHQVVPENVSTAIVRGLKALPSVAIEPRTLYIFDLIRQMTPSKTFEEDSTARPLCFGHRRRFLPLFGSSLRPTKRWSSGGFL